VLEPRRLLSIFTVDRLTDLGEGHGAAGDLRYCMTQAGDGDRITFGVNGTINITQALPTLDHSIAIQGPGANLLTVRRDPSGAYCRIFTVASGAAVSIAGLSASYGDLQFGQGDGAGIYNAGMLVLKGCTISHNHLDVMATSPHGAGIYNAGELILAYSTVSGNYILNNDVPSYGAGIANMGVLTVDSSTVSGNFGDLATQGGGVYNQGTFRVRHSTITDNGYVSAGGGIEGDVFEMIDTIVAGNATYGDDGPDLLGNINQSSYNLIGDPRGGSGFSPTDLLDVDPQLGALQDNGGPTFTHALLPGSPAIDAGDNTGAPPYDQRGPGFPRIVNGTIDIGAFEFQGQSRLPGGTAISPLGIDALAVQAVAAQPMVPPTTPVSPTELAGGLSAPPRGMDTALPAPSATATETMDYLWVRESSGAAPAWWDSVNLGTLMV
jgi:hypothetical protein